MERGSQAGAARLASVGPDPMEVAENALESMGWAFNRRSEGLITFGVDGRGGRYACAFFWDSALSALRFIARFEGTAIPPARQARAAQAVMTLNAALPLGHFRLEDDGSPAFAHTLLLGGVSLRTGRGQVRALLSLAFQRCEEALHAFAILAKRGGRAPSAEVMSLALARPAGRA